MGVTADIDRDRLVSSFLKLVAIDSPSGDEAAISTYLERRFTDLGCKVTRDGIGNIVAVLPGRRDGTILVSTHMDTVGADRGITPIIGDDGVIRTDGSTILGADDKSGIAGCLELIQVLQADPGATYPTIEFVVTVGEEVGLVGSQHLDMSTLRATHGFVLDTAGPMGSITYWAPTAVDLKFTFHGRKAHAGVEPEKGVDALRAAAQAIVSMPLGRVDEETVANIGVIRGGEATNVVPALVALDGEARSHDQGKLDAQLETMERVCREAADAYGARVDAEVNVAYHTYRIDPDATPYREAAAAIRSLGLEVVPRKSGGGTDGNHFNAHGVPCVGLPTGMVDEHAPSEHIAIDDMVTACRIMAAIAVGPS